MKTNQSRFFYAWVSLIIISYILRGCTPANLSATPSILNSEIAPSPSIPKTPQITYTPTPDGDPISTITSTLEPFPNFTITPSSKLLPDILLYLGVTRMDQCLTEKRNQIWYTVYPYDVIQPLLADPKIDYNYPQWSPDGEWIAYLESKPSVVSDWDPSPIITGTDAIWIMRPNGSDQRSIGSGIPSMIIRGMSGCQTTSGITSPPIWSPDSRHIVYVQSFWNQQTNHFEYSYYLSQMDSGETRLFQTLTSYGEPLWSHDSESIFLAANSGEILIIGDLFNKDLKVVSVDIPSEVRSEARFNLLGEKNGRVIISIFHGSNNISPKPKSQSIWELNVYTGQWMKLVDLSIETWFSPIMGTQGTVLCGNDSITILDPITWQSVGSKRTFAGMQINCEDFKLISNSDGKEMASFTGYLSDSKGLWVAEPLTENSKPALILNLLTISSTAGSQMQIFDYSFRP